jgi:maltose alpha-D-glucosyltransferase/alpha-amylase
MTCNHDTPRNTVTLSPDELKLAYAVIFTLPGVPFLYYGDEIGMRYIKMNSKEGGYERTGTRTPMQWDHSKNLGFSKGAADMLYLPVDSNADAPTVEDQEKDPSSLLHIVRDVIGLRHREKDLWADGGFEVIQGNPEHQTFVYKRGNLILAVNPSGKTESVKLEGNLGEVLYRIGDGKASGSELTLNGPSFICVRLS